MIVAIKSAMAERAERPVTEWTGEVDLGPAPGPIEVQLETIFRLFNRVDENDVARLDAIGYRLPSLSAGDTVTIDGRSFFCAAVGWEEVQ